MKFTRLFILIGTLMAALITTAAPAHAAVPRSHWTLGWGATITQGTITWGSGYTATADFYLKAVSGTRQVCLTATSGDGSIYDESCLTVPAGRTYSDYVQLRVPVTGGVQHLYVALWADGDWRRSAHCTRAQEGCASTS